MKIEVIDNPGEEWDGFVAKYTGNIFFRSIWGRVLADGLEAKLSYCCFRENGEIVGGAPGIILNYCCLKLYYSSLHYGGYLGEKRYVSRFYTELLAYLKGHELKVDIAYILPPLHDAVGPDNGEMKREKTAITYVDIESKILSELVFNSGVKQSLRRAEKLGLQFKICDDKESMDKAFSLYVEAMKRNKAMVKYPLKWFDAIHSSLIEKGFADLFMVFYENNAIASVIALYSDDGIHLLNAGTSTGSLHLRASDFIQHEIIKIGIAKQKKYIDFMHSSPDDTKLIQWKEKFGSRTEYTDNFTLVNSRYKYMCWNAAKKIYPIFSR